MKIKEIITILSKTSIKENITDYLLDVLQKGILFTKDNSFYLKLPNSKIKIDNLDIRGEVQLGNQQETIRKIFSLHRTKNVFTEYFSSFDISDNDKLKVLTEILKNKWIKEYFTEIQFIPYFEKKTGYTIFNKKINKTVEKQDEWLDISSFDESDSTLNKYMTFKYHNPEYVNMKIVKEIFDFYYHAIIKRNSYDKITLPSDLYSFFKTSDMQKLFYDKKYISKFEEIINSEVIFAYEKKELLFQLYRNDPRKTKKTITLLENDLNNVELFDSIHIFKKEYQAQLIRIFSFEKDFYLIPDNSFKTILSFMDKKNSSHVYKQRMLFLHHNFNKILNNQYDIFSMFKDTIFKDVPKEIDLFLKKEFNISDMEYFKEEYLKYSNLNKTNDLMEKRIIEKIKKDIFMINCMNNIDLMSYLFLFDEKLFEKFINDDFFQSTARIKELQINLENSKYAFNDKSFAKLYLSAVYKIVSLKDDSSVLGIQKKFASYILPTDQQINKEVKEYLKENIIDTNLQNNKDINEIFKYFINLEILEKSIKKDIIKIDELPQLHLNI